MAYEQHIRDAAGEKRAARCAIITLSDSRSPSTDVSGRRIRELLEGDGHAVADYQLIRDEPAELQKLLLAMLGRHDIDAVLTTGGTGIGRRDHTIGVVESCIDQHLPGFGELFRMLSWNEIGSGAMLSRATGGIARGKILFAMPGSTKAVELAMTKLILPELRHLLRELSK